MRSLYSAFISLAAMFGLGPAARQPFPTFNFSTPDPERKPWGKTRGKHKGRCKGAFGKCHNRPL